jgi:hypothetical protein
MSKSVVPSHGVVVDEAWYLERYPDIAEKVRDGTFDSAQDHYLGHGQHEGRLPAAPVPKSTEPRRTNSRRRRK